jgi:ATP-dependent exoDNAse (exonuclease V) alpha subunit
VIGAALARRAALELESGAGIPSTSLTALLDQLRRRPLPRRSVLVVDEAGMVPTRVLSELVEHVKLADAKLVLVGDDRQLPEIGAGGAFRALTTRLPAIELRENRRQAAAWEREALAVLRAGEPEEAIRRFQARGRIVSGEDADGVRRQLVADWWQTGDVGGAVMIAHRRRDVADLNGRAHALMRASGALGPAELAGFAVGDRVVMRRNDRRLGVVNGERGEVVGVDVQRRTLRVRLAHGAVALDGRYLEDGVSLGYAITGHLAQGMTCRQTFVLATDGMSREWAYVALTSGREANRLYVVGGDVDERAEFAPAATRRAAGQVLGTGLQRSEAQQLALDPTEARMLQVRGELASLERRLEEGRQLVPGPRHKLRFWQREPARIMEVDGAVFLQRRTDELRGELEMLESQRQREVAAPRRPEVAARAAEIRESRRALGRDRGFGLER